jgi:hypothetical protein
MLGARGLRAFRDGLEPVGVAAVADGPEQEPGPARPLAVDLRAAVLAVVPSLLAASDRCDIDQDYGERSTGGLISDCRSA